MKSLFTLASAAVVALSASVTGAAAHITLLQQNDVTIKSTDLGDGIYMLEGQGGNIGLSVGEDGVFMIDDQYGQLSEKIAAAIGEITDKPVNYLLNTHWHGDHTGGNENFAAKGATILAHDNVRARLKSGSVARDTPPAPEAALPVITFSETTTFHWNGHEIHVFHVPSAHTDGDALVHFRDINVMHLGDAFFSGRYPFIDLSSGGSVSGYIATLEAVAELADNDTVIMPGHGPVSKKSDVLLMIETLKGAQSAVKELVDAGKTEDEIVAADPLAPWNDTFAWGFITGERMTRTLVQDLTN